jgi:hypothetical protein
MRKTKPILDENAVAEKPKAEEPKVDRHKKKAYRNEDEQFDLNSATVVGTVQKIWGRTGDVFARLRVSRRGLVVEIDDTQSGYINVRFPDGMVNGQDLSLQPGDAVQVQGYLTHAEFDESIRKFLETAGEPDFLDNVPPDDLPGWRAIKFKRVNIMFNAEKMMILDKAARPTVINRMTFEGIVAREWPIGDDHYLRLAVYDEKAPLAHEQGNFGRPRRLPHYITVQFPGGKVAGREVVVRLKDRLRVTGEIRDQGWQRTLHEALLRTGAESPIDLMQRLPNADKLQTISAQLESGYVEATAVIVYTPTSRHK